MPDAPHSDAGSSGQSIAHAVAFSTLAQVLARVLHLGLNVVASLALVRYFGPAGYGDYVFVMSFCTLFGLLSDFGLTKVAVRDMSRSQDHQGAVLGTSMLMRLALALLSLLLVQGVLLGLGIGADLRLAAAVASVQYVADALLSIVAVFQLRLAMQYEALVTVVGQAIDTGLILLLSAHSAPLQIIVGAPVLSGFVAVAIAVVIARRRFGAVLSVDLALVSDLARQALPVGLTLLIAVAYLKIDSVLLGLLATPRDVGIYGAAYKPMEYLLLAAAIVVQPLFTLLSRWYAVDRARFDAVYRRGSEILLAYAFPVAVMIACIGEPLVRAAYSEDFAPASVPMLFLSIGVTFMIISSWQGFTLLASGKQRVTLVYDAAGLVVNAILNVVLIRWLGYMGAALAALGTSLFVVACSTIATHRLIGVRLNVDLVMRLMLANAALGCVVWSARVVGVPWLIAAIVGGLTYPLWLFACRVTNLDELRFVLGGRSLSAAEILA